MRWQICLSTGEYIARANSAPVTLGYQPSGINNPVSQQTAPGFFVPISKRFPIELGWKLRWFSSGLKNRRRGFERLPTHCAEGAH
jgi:hypothetical protein